MSLGEIAVLAFIIAAFTIFAVTLAWASRGDRIDRTAATRNQKARRPAARLKLGAAPATGIMAKATGR